jgi:ABC-2 type transport system ATP-binding protein
MEKIKVKGFGFLLFVLLISSQFYVIITLDGYRTNKGEAIMILELKNIDKSFGETKVLKGVSFRVEGGKAFGLLGRNGAGKTTTIRILMGVFPANSGEILVDGKNIDYKTIGMGYLPEERGLYPKKVIIDQLIYFAMLKGMGKKDAVKSIDYWLDRLGMMEYRNKKLDILSKGNQQKIQLITALAHDPEIIILDEPFSGLDPVNAMLLKDVVKEQIKKGKIVLFSSHQMSYIEEFCDSIAIINKGKVALSGDINEIKRNYPRDRLVVKTVDTEKLKKDFEGRCTVENNSVIIKLDNPNEKSETMKTLIEKYDIDEIKVLEPSLNDIFVEYAGEGAK